MRQIKAVLILLLAVFLVGCNEKIDKLTRVDVFHILEDGSYDQEVIIADNKSTEKLKKIFDEVTWEENTKVELVRKEDVKVVLFLEFDKNMPERLVEYLIYFNKNGSVNLIDKEKNKFGTLSKESGTILEGILLK